MFDIRDPKTSARIEKMLKDGIQTIINGCALVFIFMVLTLLAVLGYIIYVICTM